MKILFCGLGSIGQRHLRNLLQLSIENLEISAYRSRGLPILINQDLTIVEGVDLAEIYNIHIYETLDRALDVQPDIVFITNPSSKHLDTLRAVIDKTKADVFIEKPLAHSKSGLAELMSKVKENNTVAFVGFQNRFHPCIKKAAELLSLGIVGRVVSASIEVGEYMPGFHKYEDYRETYAAKKELGGGVILSQIHEIDYACYLFGKPASVYAVGGKLSHLDIDVEDTVNILLGYDFAERQFPVGIHMDFLQNPPSRQCKIVGTHGKIEFDLFSNKLCCYDDVGSIYVSEQYDAFNRNDMFMEELRLFMSIREGLAEPVLTLDEGLKSLEVALAAKESMRRCVPILLAT